MPTLRALLAYWKKNYTDANEHREIMIALVSAVAFAVLFILRWFGLPYPKVQAFLESDVATWIGVAGFLYAVFYLIVWLPFKRHQEENTEHAGEVEVLEAEIAALKEREKPKLKVVCDESSGCHTNKGSLPQYFRLAVTADGAENATGCFGKLIKVEKNGVVIRDHDIEQLPFARSYEADALSKTLMPGVTEYLDVLAVAVVGMNPPSVYASVTGGKLTVLRDVAQNDVLQSHGDYTLTVALGGKGIPVQTHRFLFKWTGAGDTSSLNLIP